MMTDARNDYDSLWKNHLFI